MSLRRFLMGAVISILLIFVLFLSNISTVIAASGDKEVSINEKYGLPIVVYGERYPKHKRMK